MVGFQNLYPQYRITTERRKQNVAVPFERRSGDDRRTQDRVALDTTLTRDLFEVKSKISQLQKTNPVNFTQDVSKAASNSLTTDQFVKTSNPLQQNTPPKTSEPVSSTALLGGILATALAGVIAGSFFGAPGAVIAVGLGVYMGGKALKQAVVAHMVDKKTDKK